MTTLRELISQQLEVEALDDIDEQTLHDTLEGLTGTLTDKVDAIAGLLDSWSHTEDVISLEIKRLQARKGMFGNRKRRLKAYLAYQLKRLNDPKLETDLHSVSLRKGQVSVIIDDDARISGRYLKTTVAIDKAALKTALKDGEVIDGARLERGEDYVVLR